MTKVCLIRQHAGLGDILFCLKIARSMTERGYRVVWPVISQYSFISDYIKIKNLFFVDENKPFPYKHVYNSGIINIIEQDDFVYIPLQTADVVFPNIPINESKYRLVGLDFRGWEEAVDIHRNQKKEEELYYNVCNLKDDEDYIFFNSLYGSPPHSKKLKNMEKVYLEKDCFNKIAELEFVDGYNPFDWSLVLENSRSIYTVDTCFIAIMEKLNIKTNNLYMYSRREYDDFMYQIKPYFTDRWNYKDKNLYLKES